MLAKILSWLVGGGIAAIAKPLSEAYQARLNAQNDSQKIAAQLTIDSLEKQMNALIENRRMTSGFWEMRLISFIIAACATAHYAAVTVDTIGQFSWNVAAYPAPFNEYEGSILLSFFGIYAAGRGIQTIANAIISRK